jgi:hypothetical protein
MASGWQRLGVYFVCPLSMLSQYDASLDCEKPPVKKLGNAFTNLTTRGTPLFEDRSTVTGSVRK